MVIEAAALAVADGLLPFTFAYQKPDMKKFAAALIASGQIVPATAAIDIHDLLPTSKAVRESIKHLAQTDRDRFRQVQLNGILDVGSGGTIDGVKQTTTGTKYYDFNLYYMELKKPHPVTKERSFCLRYKAVFTINHSGSETAESL